MASKTFSDNQRAYHRTTLKKLLESFEVGQEYYTHHFEFLHDKFGYLFSNDRSLLRKSLRTLEADGLIENINLGCNIHRWKLTTNS